MPEEFADKLLKLESDYRKKLTKVRDKYYLIKPEIGLDEKLRKSWEYYRETFQVFEQRVIDKALTDISQIAQTALKTNNVSSPIRKWALENSQTRLKEESDSIKKRIIETKNSVIHLTSEIDCVVLK